MALCIASVGNVSPEKENAITEYPPASDIARRISAVKAMIKIATLMYAKINKIQPDIRIQILPLSGTPITSKRSMNIMVENNIIAINIGINFPIIATLIEPCAEANHSPAVEYLSSEPMEKIVDNTVKIRIIIGIKLGDR